MNINNKKAQDSNILWLYILDNIYVYKISPGGYTPELHFNNFRSINLLTGKKIKL